MDLFELTYCLALNVSKNGLIEAAQQDESLFNLTGGKSFNNQYTNFTSYEDFETALTEISSDLYISGPSSDFTVENSLIKIQIASIKGQQDLRFPI